MNLTDATSVSQALVAEFSDVHDVGQLVRIVLRMGLALALGCALGYERESHGKAAGVRTHMLVAMGSSLFMLLPLQLGASVADLSRVAQGLVVRVLLGMGLALVVFALVPRLNPSSEQDKAARPEWRDTDSG